MTRGEFLVGGGGTLGTLGGDERRLSMVESAAASEFLVCDSERGEWSVGDDDDEASNTPADEGDGESSTDDEDARWACRPPGGCGGARVGVSGTLSAESSLASPGSDVDVLVPLSSLIRFVSMVMGDVRNFFSDCGNAGQTDACCAQLTCCNFNSFLACLFLAFCRHMTACTSACSRTTCAGQPTCGHVAGVKSHFSLT